MKTRTVTLTIIACVLWAVFVLSIKAQNVFTMSDDSVLNEFARVNYYRDAGNNTVRVLILETKHRPVVVKDGDKWMVYIQDGKQ